MTIDTKFFKKGRSYVEATFTEVDDCECDERILETDPKLFWDGFVLETDPGQVCIWYEESDEEAVLETMQHAGFVVPPDERTISNLMTFDV